MRVSITNCYTWLNKGDAAIVLGIVDSIKDYWKADEINLYTFSPKLDKEKYTKEGSVDTVYESVLNIHPYNNRSQKIAKILHVILKYLIILLKIKLNKISDKKLKVLADSDCIIICGGGFLGGSKIGSLIHLMLIHLNQKLNSNVVLLGASVEPGSNLVINYLTKKVLNNCKVIVARETITMDYFNNNICDNVIKFIGPDFAFYNKTYTSSVEKENIVGFTVRNWFSSKKEQDHYELKISQIIKTIYKKYNFKFYYVPQVSFYTNNDSIVADRISNFLNDGEIVMNTKDLSPNEIRAMISKFKFFIGTRMHSNIFALTMRVPTCAIGYEKKTFGIMNMFDLQDFVVDINDFTTDEVVEKFSKLVDSENDVKKLIDQKHIKLLKDFEYILDGVKEAIC